jgi:hypothetical protein
MWVISEAEKDFSCKKDNLVAIYEYRGHIHGKPQPNISTIRVGRIHALYNS